MRRTSAPGLCQGLCRAYGDNFTRAFTCVCVQDRPAAQCRGPYSQLHNFLIFPLLTGLSPSASLKSFFPPRLLPVWPLPHCPQTLWVSPFCQGRDKQNLGDSGAQACNNMHDWAFALESGCAGMDDNMHIDYTSVARRHMENPRADVVLACKKARATAIYLISELVLGRTLSAFTTTNAARFFATRLH